MIQFRPRPWPTIIALVMLAILLGLGTWQLERRVWKTELLATIAQHMNANPIELPPRIDDPDAWRFRNVRLAGRFDNAHALRLYGRTLDGKAGVHLLVPLIRQDGAPILVDRGFVPFATATALADITSSDDPQDLFGVVRLPEPAGWFLPASNPAENIWYAVDIPRMSAATGLALAPVYVAARPQGGAGWPQATGGTEGAGIRNEHLNYAIFWFSMAGVLIAIYVASSTRRVRPSRKS
jgi:surfeit locus 1 family protein